MEQITIQPNECLNRQIQAFYHDDYQGGNVERRETTGTVENIVCTLKNQFNDKNPSILQQAANDLIQILKTDLPQILQKLGRNNLTVCVIARAKAENTYSENQKLFRRTIKLVVEKLGGFLDGTDYIIRHTNTKTTHMNKSGYGGDGDMPYPGITKDTCSISENVRGRDILLLDDLYTKSINIDEDAIQALLDKGTKSVVFYSVGKTVSRNQII